MTSLLNSNVVWFYLSNIVAQLGNKAFRMKKTYLNLLPIPKISEEKQKIFEILVDYIMYLKEYKKEKYIIDFFERVINIAVYELYFEDEIKSNAYQIIDILIKDLEEFDNSYKTIQNIYKNISNKNHKVAYAVNYVDTLDIVKIIENK